ncbi:hypothetical protein [Roseobacter litoralis]|uniref:hypothetical protein n=1 Tax=Roseobacter litoralis TaxID=42443 RepID=UPI00249527B0|nr:hypothetical protein [Roseobacter litoralis]
MSNANTPTTPSAANAASQEMKQSKQGRLVETFLNSLGDDAVKQATLDKRRNEAMGARLKIWSSKQEEKAKIDLFVDLEMDAPKSVRNLIATHPDRPAKVDEILAKADAAKEAAKAEAVEEKNNAQRAKVIAEAKKLGMTLQSDDQA